MQFQKLLQTVNEYKGVLDKKIPMYVGVGLAISYFGYKMLKGKKSESTTDTGEQEKLTQNSQQSEENDIIEVDQNKQIEKPQSKTSEPKQKRKQIMQRINQKTKKSFQTDVEYAEPKLVIQKQNSVTLEKNTDDKLFFQIYQKMQQEVSNEDS